MNSNTGEIKEFTAEEAKAGVPSLTGFTIPLSPAEAEILSDLDPEDRLKAMKNWNDYVKTKKFNSTIEDLKAKAAFLQGLVIGRVGLG